MSFIAGIMNLDGAPADTGLIRKLADTMSARGPDERRYWSAGSVALGHGMLSTTPESLDEHQPLLSSDGMLALVWDGRLDNRDDLRRALIAAGAVLRTRSDAEFVLQSYAVWGEDCPTRLLGDFAFAVWDSRQNRVFCARDHMGARPFYYACNDRMFAFGSEDEALTLLPGVSRRPNEQLVAHCLVPGFQGSDHLRTWFEDVCSLPPATKMTVSMNGVVLSQAYWELTPGEEHAFVSDNECREAFLEVFGQAVRCRLRLRGDAAAMLSGGLDSAGLAAMVKRLLPEPRGMRFHTYSAISDHPETCAESRCIRTLAADLGSDAHFLAVPSFTGMLNVGDLIEVGWSRPHPVDNSILLPAMMCLAASRDGHRVLLHGVSGDLTMHVPNRYIARILLDGHWLQAWQECRSASRNFTYSRGISPLLLLLQNAWSAYAPRQLDSVLRRLREERTDAMLATSLINRAFGENIGLAERISAMKREAGLPLADLQREHIRVLSLPSGIANGLQAYDSVAARFGLELRDPWGDKRVVEFFLRLPLKHKVREGWTKYLVRTGFAPDLAPEIRWRSGKEHLGWHFIGRLMRETQSLVAHSMDRDLAAAERYIDVAAFRKRCAKYCASKGLDEWDNMYNTIVLMHWLQRSSS